MKIAIISHTLFPIKKPYSGKVEGNIHLLCTVLRSLGHEIDLYAHPASDSTLLVKPKVFPYRGKTGHDVGAEKTGDIDCSMWYPCLFSQVNAANYDIVHNHSFQDRPTPLGNYPNASVITSLHSLQNAIDRGGAGASKNLYCNVILVSRRIGNHRDHNCSIIYTTLPPQAMVDEYLNIYGEIIE